MNKRMYLTKKREKALRTALCIDDVLYEKFRRLNEQLHRDTKRLMGNRMTVFKVLRVRGNVTESLQIVDVRMSIEGSVIYVT